MFILLVADVSHSLHIISVPQQSILNSTEEIIPLGCLIQHVMFQMSDVHPVGRLCISRCLYLLCAQRLFSSPCTSSCWTEESEEILYVNLSTTISSCYVYQQLPCTCSWCNGVKQSGRYNVKGPLYSQCLVCPFWATVDTWQTLWTLLPQLQLILEITTMQWFVVSGNYSLMKRGLGDTLTLWAFSLVSYWCSAANTDPLLSCCYTWIRSPPLRLTVCLSQSVVGSFTSSAVSLSIDCGLIIVSSISMIHCTALDR